MGMVIYYFYNIVYNYIVKKILNKQYNTIFLYIKIIEFEYIYFLIYTFSGIFF